ncbi:MAG TPA: hypothetical protein VI894_03640 [Candidatus Nanoarchaeia archaeon]|nr:hypothetical protein [Candidatus Nanoarchaeia archaeon]
MEIKGIEERVSKILQTKEYKGLSTKQKAIANTVLLQAKKKCSAYQNGEFASIYSALDTLYSPNHPENHDELNKWISEVYGKDFYEMYATHRTVKEAERRG